ncbi:MAG: hypothetical protein A2864_00145 [Candidatus Woykebacteria bacterium RIFCSPHIGHO2_01_FULL_39_12]|uniref:Uncharacterized protein n=1 Tax=Candidatus Woykebacteria bacterium RIFCSPHIGHO2_01_FULL_39_12 TaxID=1802599 RepID=A0A1G1WLB9_9BACT|nr:MAG: hypothetical protein A2864_00145 [Candidatus Woykebacteria bacterium RIFCSPHIGHO2_01_FULL_39_12]
MIIGTLFREQAHEVNGILLLIHDRLRLNDSAIEEIIARRVSSLCPGGKERQFLVYETAVNLQGSQESCTAMFGEVGWFNLYFGDQARSMSSHGAGDLLKDWAFQEAMMTQFIEDWRLTLVGKYIPTEQLPARVLNP